MWLVLEKRGIHRNPKTVLRIMKLYLSMIRDLYDNSIVAYKTGTEQTVNLVLDTIRHKPAAFSEANEMIGRYIHFYNHERIQLTTGEVPLARRLSA